MIPVVLVDDHQLLTQALAVALERDGGFRVVAALEDASALEAVRAAHPGALYVIDLTVPGGGPERPIALARAGEPVVVVSAFATPQLTAEFLRAGVLGVLSKSLSTTALTAALRAAWEGCCVVDPALARTLGPPTNPLSERERDVLRAASDGAPLAEVALRVNLAHGTVRNLLSEAMRRLGARNRLEAVTRARERGWI